MDRPFFFGGWARFLANECRLCLSFRGYALSPNDTDQAPAAETPKTPEATAPTSSAAPAGTQPVLPKTKKKIPYLFLVLLFIHCSLIVTPIVGFWYAFSGAGPLETEHTIVIPKGKQGNEIGVALEGNGVVWNSFLFRLAVKLRNVDSLQAGEYLFPAHISIADVITMMHEGKVVIRRITFAEGLTSYEMITLLNEEPALTGKITTIPADGTLFPATYRYTYGDSRHSVIEQMQKKQREILSEIWGKHDAELPVKTEQEALVLASIVEKETGKKAEERPRVAGVFYNRLKQSMRLQSDPTVIYALTKGKGALPRNLTHDDLATPSPYNTYASDGLPPKPICNPGRAALEAVAHPEKNDFLYFVADGTGGHVFAKTLDEHNHNVAQWNKINRD